MKKTPKQPAVPHKLIADLAEALVDLPPRDRGPFIRRLLAETNELVAFYEAHDDFLVSEAEAFRAPSEIGPYRRVRLIGEGAMAQVYEAWDPTHERKVALKTIRPGLLIDRPSRKRFWKRFVREARICRRLNHPNIVALIDYFEDTQPYIVLELVEGPTLAERLKKEGVLDRAQALALVRQICDALAHAHRAGVVHRDLKPSNILFDPENRAKLTDFGIGKLTGIRSLTNTGFLGTPLYASPEQITGKGIDQTADLFALALVIHVVATSRHPYRGDSVEQTLYNLASKPPSLGQPHAALALDPGLFRRFMSRALARDPRARFPDAESFRVAFHRMAAGGRTSGSGPKGQTDAYRAKRSSNPNRSGSGRYMAGFGVLRNIPRANAPG